MDTACYSCCRRFTGECDGNTNTHVKKLQKENKYGDWEKGQFIKCDDYRRVLVRDAARDGRDYRVIIDHKFVEQLSANDTIDKYGDWYWDSGYSCYDYIDIWISRRD